MSPQFIYNLRENEGEGMYGRDVMRILSKIGVCYEDDYKYGTKETKEELTANNDVIAKALNFKIQKNEKKTFSGMITAWSDFGNVTFKVKSKSTQLTTLSIRVGVFGDREASDLIYAKIKPKL